MWFNGKTPFTGGGMIADVPAQHRLSPSNPTFRGNLLVTEGTTAGTAILAQPNGVMLQDLPFSVELKKFIVEYYDTGMPRLFASDIVIHDHDTGEKKEARVEVNHPAQHRGINIYQSSFDDGGSKVTMQALPLGGTGVPFEVSGVIGGSTALTSGDTKLNLEYTGLRVINVENFSQPAGADGADVRKVDLRTSIESRLGAGHKTVTEKTLRNVGPSITYKLRDAAGQAVEYNNYMLPVELDGERVYLLGARETPSEPLRYLRIPVDDQDGIEGFVRLRAALADPAQREEAVRRYAEGAVEPGRPELTEALMASAQRALALFAGVEAGPPPAGGTVPEDQLPRGGLPSVSGFLEANVPEAEREKASDVLVRILNGTLFELLQVSRERAGLKPLDRSDTTQAFMAKAVLSLSDSFYYPAPLTFMLKDFQHVQASVFQVARAPGQTIVYIGCLLLIVGIFAMLYVRERRVWVWLAPQGSDASQASMALSSNRKTMESDQEFELLKTQLLKVTA
jgi:cytochrome c biogenesis protein